ncbi:glycosyl hydrolase family 65 protein [Maricurvus nonylphenolicus]|uniref:glycoside hydrolase family 65 protein n=1 Tax=Maricurvus nonylphenolicus TaxID=1008307 RepID=UPI0036F4312A
MSQHIPSFYPADPWQLRETHYAPEQLPLSETLFALGNGYLGIRGDFEEAGLGSSSDAAPSSGTFLNGVYTSTPITYGEKAYGYATHNQCMVTAPNGKLIELRVDGERFCLDQGELLDYERTLDFRTGILQRKLTWRSPTGKTLAITIQRLVSLDHQHLSVIHYQVTPIDFSGCIQWLSGLDANLPSTPLEEGDDPRAGSGVSAGDIELLQRQGSEDQLLLLQHIHSSGFELASGATHRINAAGDIRVNHSSSNSGAQVEYSCNAAKGETVSLTKYLAYYSFATDNAELTKSNDDHLQDLRSHLDNVATKNFAAYASQQQKNLENFWSTADIEVRGDPSLQQGIRFNLFHLYQSLGRDGKTNIAAKGLSGDGYDGHYFWDTEIYILPFFLYTQPAMARKLLEYRHHILDAARQRARDLAIAKGALFPWRTIGGDECSAYYPAGTAQYHINADIAYAVQRYFDATGDAEFMREYGAEIVLESARLWIELGNYDYQDHFCINTVTGPDEYTALVNNNFYTNVMAKNHLAYAYEVHQWLAEESPETLQLLIDKLELSDDEPKAWQKASAQMFLPFDQTLGIHAQDDGFLDKKIWDFNNTPAENYPLLLHYHPLTIYRHQVCKQADVLLALFLHSDQFSQEQKQQDFDYYEAITTHDSTLSACIHSIIASEVGYTDKAQAYFQQVARMDLDNHHNNTQYGVHTACMGGAWMCMVNGFAGLRIEDEQLHFNPYLPPGMEGYTFRIQFKGSLIEVDVRSKASDDVDYTLISGAPLTIQHRDKEIHLHPSAGADQPTAITSIA